MEPGAELCSGHYETGAEEARFAGLDEAMNAKGTSKGQARQRGQLGKGLEEKNYFVPFP